VRTEKILEIDFSKHEKVIIDKIVFTGATINAKKDRWDGVVITGYFNETYAFSTHYEKEEEIRINEKEDYLSIVRKVI